MLTDRCVTTRRSRWRGRGGRGCPLLPLKLAGVGVADDGCGRGRRRRWSAIPDTRSRQNDAQVREEVREGDERARGGRRVPYGELNGGGTGEMRPPIVGSPAA